MAENSLRNRGVQAALTSAALFGAGTPLAKLLLGEVSPWLLAGLLYCGSGFGLALIRLVRRAPRVRLHRGQAAPLLGAIVCGGIVGPVLLLAGLSGLPASGASLLLNAEGVLTALLAWFVFGENVDRRVALGMAAIVAGSIVLSVPSGAQLGSLWPTLLVLGACLAWALDNNLTRSVALHDAGWLAAVKGAVAGPVNLILALAFGTRFPQPVGLAAALVIGFFAYGISLTLFIVALRNVGTARAGAYFAIAPFFGALLALALGDAVTWQLAVAGLLMGAGVWLHLSERHIHEHTHEPITHDHWHVYDEHHRHDHAGPDTPAAGHSHLHTHEPITHTHEHYPDAHHRHHH